MKLDRDANDPWRLRTPPGSSEFTMHVDEKDGTVEAWERSPTNPLGGWYGLKKSLRRRFGVYVPPLMETLDLCELEHNARNKRIRAK